MSIHPGNILVLLLLFPCGYVLNRINILRLKFDIYIYIYIRWSQWPCDLRRRSTDARLLRLWVRIPPEAWISVCCECCVLSGRRLCDTLITRPEEYYRLWNLVNEEAMARVGPQRHGGGGMYVHTYTYIFLKLKQLLFLQPQCFWMLQSSREAYSYDSSQMDY